MRASPPRAALVDTFTGIPQMTDLGTRVRASAESLWSGGRRAWRWRRGQLRRSPRSRGAAAMARARIAGATRRLQQGSGCCCCCGCCCSCGPVVRVVLVVDRLCLRWRRSRLLLFGSIRHRRALFLASCSPALLPSFFPSFLPPSFFFCFVLMLFSLIVLTFLSSFFLSLLSFLPSFLFCFVETKA